MADVVKSAEDIQKAPKQPKDERSATEKALTRHVDNFELPPDATDAVAEPDVDLGDFKLPKTLKASHELLAEVQSAQPGESDKDLALFAKEKAAKIAAVMAHLAKLGDVPTPTIKSASFREIVNAQSNHADELKLDLLARSHPEVKALLAERDKLREEIKNLTKKAA